MRRLAIILTAMLLWSCGGENATFYHHYEAVGGRGWQAGDTLRFSLPEAPHTGRYPVFLGMRFRPHFPYKGVWIVTETRVARSAAVQRDTVFYSFVDSVANSNRHGLAYVQTECPLSLLHLQKGQQADISIYHHMTREVLPDITDIGLRVNQREEKESWMQLRF